MDAERHARATELFGRAVELGPTERAAFVASECRGDPELLREVQSLLSHHRDESPSQLLGWKPLTLADEGSQSNEESMAGRAVGRFQIIDEIGRGGMGIVWRADDPVLGRRVAIKFLPPQLARSSDARDQFVREARAASALDHPGVATIYDFGEFEGKFFIALRLVEGDTVARRLDSGPLPASVALRVAIDVARALEHAHERRVLHRDVSTNNIIVTPDGHGVLLDFGLAASIGAVREATRRGGTPNYVAPEVVAGGTPDEKSDVFALGVVLYEMLTGRNPFSQSGRASEISNEAIRSLRRPSDTVRGLPRQLDDVVLRALESEPHRRTSSASTLAAQLERLARASAQKPKQALVVATSIASLGLLALVATQFLGAETIETVADPALAVWTTSGPDSVGSAALDGLLQLGLSENTSTRVISSAHVGALRHRADRDGRRQNPIDLARDAGATVVLVTETPTDTGGKPTVEWKLVETRKRRTMDRGRITSRNLMDAVDVIVRSIIPEVAAHSGTRATLEEMRPVSTMTTTSPEAYRLYVQSVNALYQVKPASAVSDLWAALALDSTFSLASYTLSRELFEAGYFSASDSCADLAWRHRSSLSFRDRLRLDAWRDRLASDGASEMETYEEILARWPDDREALFDMLHAKWWYWRWAESLQYAEMGHKLYPDDMHFTMMCVVTLALEDRPLEAIPLARARIAAQNSFDAWNDLAGCYIRASMLDSAMIALEEGMRVEPNPRLFQEGIATIAYYQGDLERATEIFEAVANDDDLSPQERYQALSKEYLGVAGLYAQAGRFQDAINLVREMARHGAGEVRPAVLATNLSFYLSRAGRYQEALDQIALFRQSDWWKNDAQVSKAKWVNGEIEALIGLGRLDEARTLLDEGDKANKQSVKGPATRNYYARARIAIAEGKPENAVRYIEESIAQGLLGGPKDIEYHELRAQAYRAMGRMDEAEAALRYNVRRYPSHGIGHYYLGQLLEEKGARDEAEAEYRLFLTKWSRADRGRPEIVDTRERLAALSLSR